MGSRRWSVEVYHSLRIALFIHSFIHLFPAKCIDGQPTPHHFFNCLRAGPSICSPAGDDDGYEDEDEDEDDTETKTKTIA